MRGNSESGNLFQELDHENRGSSCATASTPHAIAPPFDFRAKSCAGPHSQLPIGQRYRSNAFYGLAITAIGLSQRTPVLNRKGALCFCSRLPLRTFLRSPSRCLPEPRTAVSYRLPFVVISTGRQKYLSQLKDVIEVLVAEWTTCQSN